MATLQNTKVVRTSTFTTRGKRGHHVVYGMLLTCGNHDQLSVLHEHAHMHRHMHMETYALCNEGSEGKVVSECDPSQDSLHLRDSRT